MARNRRPVGLLQVLAEMFFAFADAGCANRRAPSHVVRLQSMLSVCESSVGIVIFPGTKLLNVSSMLSGIS